MHKLDLIDHLAVLFPLQYYYLLINGPHFSKPSFSLNCQKVTIFFSLNKRHGSFMSYVKWVVQHLTKTSSFLTGLLLLFALLILKTYFYTFQVKLHPCNIFSLTREIWIMSQCANTLVKYSWLISQCSKLASRRLLWFLHISRWQPPWCNQHISCYKLNL